MRTYLFPALLIVGTLMGGCMTHVEPSPEEVPVPELTASKAELDSFLAKYDIETIKEDKRPSLALDAERRELLEGLPPRTPDLFASGLYMPYDDDMGIYHDYDHIYFKMTSGRWDLDAKGTEKRGSGFVFTKEEGFSR